MCVSCQYAACQNNNDKVHAYSMCAKSAHVLSVGRLRAASFDGSKFDTGVYQVPLALDEVRHAIKLSIVTVIMYSLQEYHMLTISNSSFPLYVSVNLALTSSRTDSHEQSPQTS